MGFFENIWLNIWSLVLGSLLALGFFYAFYDSTSLTADVLQQQRQQDSKPDIVYERENGQLKIFLNKKVNVQENMIAEFVLWFDENEVVLKDDPVFSKFPMSYTQDEGWVIVELQIDRSAEVNEELFVLNFDWGEDDILLLNAKFLIDGELEEFAIGEETNVTNNEWLH